MQKDWFADCTKKTRLEIKIRRNYILNIEISN